MKLNVQKNGFLGIDQGVSFETSYNQARTVIVPFGMESGVSYGKGTKSGPGAILKASHELNENDEKTFSRVYETGLATLKAPAIPKNPQRALNLLSKLTAQISKDGKFPIVLGGEHTLTLGAISGVARKFSDISVLHFDAHADLRKQYRGSKYSHASALRRVMEELPIKKLVQIGIRTISEVDDELGFLKRQRKRIKTFWGWRRPSPKQVLAQIPTKNVYITFDVDGFDPGIMPSTGTPEPGGLLWWPTLEILEAVFKAKNVVGADIVELAPIRAFHGPDFMIARLAYKFINYKYFAKSHIIRHEK